MTQSTEAPSTSAAGPDLSGLDEALRRRIDVAVARGATWEHAPHRTYPWKLWGNGAPLVAVYVDPEDGEPHHRVDFLPDPENDPAAAWELLTSERISLQPAFSSEYPNPWEARWGLNDERDADEAIAGSPGRAVVDAFLAKHAGLVS